ncbi:MAG: PASTA domain-containing protein [bacterium]
MVRLYRYRPPAAEPEPPAAEPEPPAAEPEPPAAGGDESPPAAGGDESPPAAGGDESPPAAGGDESPPAAGGGGAPPPSAESDRVEVPDLENLTVREALVDQLRPLGLGILPVSPREETDDRSQDRRIAKQSPPAGTQVKRGSVVRIRTYRYQGESEEVKVPVLREKTPEEALARLLRPLGLGIQVVGRVDTKSRPQEGRIRDQTPRQGTRVRRGTVVQVKVYRYAPPPKPDRVKVPDLVNRTISEAERILQEVGLRLLVMSVGRHKTYDRALADRIRQQSPSQGTNVLRGSDVRVFGYRYVGRP